MSEADAPTRRAVEAVWRIEAARLIGGLVRLVRDVDRAEDLAQEALVAALERWPVSGIPENPGAWLMTTAKNRAVDEARRDSSREKKHAEWAHAAARKVVVEAGDVDAAVSDDVLRLMLVACHPILAKESRVALTLRLVAGLTTAEIARAYLSSETTIAQRIVRAKRTLAETKVEFEVPTEEKLRDRLAPILEAIYLVFNEGYSATAGEDWIRRELCEEAMRLGRILVELVPEEAEVHGLVALMELQASRLKARLGPRGEPVLLFDQDRGRWDRLLITRGLAALERAVSLRRPLGLYTLQAAIAGCHAQAGAPGETDWQRIVALYDGLVELTGSPVVELNRAVAVAMAFGPEAGLALVDELAEDPDLRDYHRLPAVRGDLLWRLGKAEAAKAEFERAAGMATNAQERILLLDRAAGAAKGN